jgi:starch phosphorylase
MSIASLQMKLHDNPNMDFVPRSFIFGAKAAAGYHVAKRIIELLLSMQRDINGDPVCKDRLQICFVENYRVSAAEAIVPAADVSEQISTAGKEASGTGCMKLMMNGAVTIGTLDGANVEMYERLGDENMFLFGLHTDEIESWRRNGYDPASIANNDEEITRIMQRFSQGFVDGKSYSDLVSGLLYGGDPYMLIADYRAYAECRDRLYTRISDESERARLALVNTAESGFFAADRAILEYAKNIWHVK